MCNYLLALPDCPRSSIGIFELVFIQIFSIFSERKLENTRSFFFFCVHFELAEPVEEDYDQIYYILMKVTRKYSGKFSATKIPIDS